MQWLRDIGTNKTMLPQQARNVAEVAWERVDADGILGALALHGSDGDNSIVEKAVRDEEYSLTSRFPVYQNC